ncbi:hypothetical protein SAMN05428953_12533 [Mesorhizobium muleiense]|uniref:Uncharacterized protein n=1 Tax=Mesorhizobium muleiense TaxID=1004279 RepID=A0A1G9GNC1_9HYPH|nr:hypothetical protein SAMN05428953_12533 [Mesorhizobium muleiense]
MSQIPLVLELMQSGRELLEAQVDVEELLVSFGDFSPGQDLALELNVVEGESLFFNSFRGRCRSRKQSLGTVEFRCGIGAGVFVFPQQVEEMRAVSFGGFGREADRVLGLRAGGDQVFEITGKIAPCDPCSLQSGCAEILPVHKIESLE